jgi:phosphopentomutase
MAAHDRDQARAELKVEQDANVDLRTSIREQNRAVEAMGKAKEIADARGAEAQRLAAANGRRFDGALEQIKGAKATTCADAMPAVNQILEAVR